MTRTEFTIKICQLILQMGKDGNLPLIDYVMRSKIEQYFLFSKGYSKCDGFTKLSKHQGGVAVDIYFVIEGNIDFGFTTEKAKELSKKYHDIWLSMGGKPLIEWDLAHYEV